VPSTFLFNNYNNTSFACFPMIPWQREGARSLFLFFLHMCTNTKRGSPVPAPQSPPPHTHTQKV
jgi:hypothetical protein